MTLKYPLNLGKVSKDIKFPSNVNGKFSSVCSVCATIDFRSDVRRDMIFERRPEPQVLLRKTPSTIPELQSSQIDLSLPDFRF